MRFVLLSTAVSALTFAQAGAVQQPKGAWQTPGAIQQPKGPWQTPGAIQVPKGIQDIRVQENACQHRVIVGADALFEFDKAALTADAATTLDALGPVLAKEGKHAVKIEGYTDAIGSAAYNQTLSEKRAQVVRDWLVSHDYLPASTPTEGFGKNRPVAPNTNPDGSDNPKGRQQNRRVEVVVDSCH